MTEPKPFGHGIAAVEKIAEPGTPRERTSVPPSLTAGVPGTAIIGGYIEDTESDFRLRGRERYRTYSNILLNRSIVGAGVRYFLNLVSKPDWKFEAPEDSAAQGEQYADLLADMIHDMETPWHRIVRRAAMYRFYGFSVQEWTAKLRADGNIGILDIAPRPQNTIEQWDVDRNGKVIGCIQDSPQTGDRIYLPREKVIYMVDDSLNDSPEGMGLFRHIADAAQRLQRYEQLEGYGFDSDLRGVPVARAPIAELNKLVANGEISESQKEMILQPLKTFMTSHIKNPQLGLLLDSMPYESQDEAARPSNVPQWSMELMKADSSTQSEILRTIERLNREIARVLGVEQLLLGDNGVGSFAMAKEKAHNFALIIDSTLMELAEQFKKDFVERVFILNGWPLEMMPTVKTDKLQYRSIEEVTAALEQLSRAGAIMMPNDPAINEVRDQLGVSRAEEFTGTDLELALAGVAPEPTESDQEKEEEDE